MVVLLMLYGVNAVFVFINYLWLWLLNNVLTCEKHLGVPHHHSIYNPCNNFTTSDESLHQDQIEVQTVDCASVFSTASYYFIYLFKFSQYL